MEPDEAAELVMRQLGSTALFAAKFREASSRALLLPRRRADGRTPLWQQRKRAYDLLSVASRYPSFPMLLEAYRECLRDVFDMPALQETLRAVNQRQIRVHVADSRTPSPFAGALLFSYVANYIYDGDAPLAERRAQALVDRPRSAARADGRCRSPRAARWRGDRGDRRAVAVPGGPVQGALDGWCPRPSVAHGRPDAGRAAMRVLPSPAEEVDGWVSRLIKARRVLELMVAGEKRLMAVEDAARLRDALGVPLPPGLPLAFLQPVPDALLDVVRRFARTHGPFTTQDVAKRYELSVEVLEATLQRLVQTGRVAEGGFRPGGVNREWIDSEVLRSIRRKSLAKLRK